jgi:cytochrome c-type biogenesis protein CcmH/NrfG
MGQQAVEQCVFAAFLSGLWPQCGIEDGTGAQAQQGNHPSDRKPQALLLGARLRVAPLIVGVFSNSDGPLK